MYEQELPNQEEMVVVRVNKVEEFGAYVTLLEYNHIEGMILSSEVSRKRIRSIHKHLRIGKQDVMQVLRVDKEKGEEYLDREGDTSRYLWWLNSIRKVLNQSGQATLISQRSTWRRRMWRRPTLDLPSQRL